MSDEAPAGGPEAAEARSGGAPEAAEARPGAPAELLAAVPPPPAAAGELVAAFLRARNPNTLRAYRRDLGDFAASLGAPSVPNAVRQLLSAGAGGANKLALDYRSGMLERRLAAATVNRRLSCLRALVKLARMLGLVAWAVEVQGLDADPYRDTRGPGEAAVAAMLRRALRRGDAKGVRDAAILRLLHDRALRRGELVSLDREHYDEERGLSIASKGRREREWVTLPRATKEALEAWLSVRGDQPGPLFVALDEVHAGHRLGGSALHYVVRRYGELVGARARPHGLRHTGITTALERTNGDVRRVQRFSRHRDVRTLLIYDDARADAGGKVASLVQIERILSCARGHAREDEGALGKFCLVGECGARRGERDPDRRIEWRELSESSSRGSRQPPSS